MEPTNLADLDFEALATQVVAIAQRARTLTAEGDAVELHELLEAVRSAANVVSGERLVLLEVAEAFLRAMARSDLGRSELALRRLFVEHPEIARVLFSRLLKPATLTEEELRASTGEARAHLDELIALGVLRKVGHAFDVRPSLRPLARDLLEPVAFRLWRRVSDARSNILRAGMPAAEASAHLAARLGVTPQEATAHLEAHPVRPALRVLDELAGRPRVAVTKDAPRTRVIYRRGKVAETGPEVLPPQTLGAQGTAPTLSLVTGTSSQSAWTALAERVASNSVDSHQHEAPPLIAAESTTPVRAGVELRWQASPARVGGSS